MPHPTKYKGYFLLSPAVTAPLPSPDPTHQPASLSFPCPGVPIPGSSVHWTVTNLEAETEQLGGNGRPRWSARPAPRVPWARRGAVRLLFPRTSGPQDSDSVSSSAAPELGGPAGLGVGFQVTSGLHLKPPMFSICCGTRLCSQPDKEDRLPRGPGGRRAGPVWLVPPVTRPRSPSDLRQDPVSAAPGPRGGLHHLPVLPPEGFPPTQESQCCFILGHF